MSKNKNNWLSKIHPEWMKQVLAPVFVGSQAKKIQDFLVSEVTSGCELSPLKEDIWNAFSYCPPKEIKVALISQDPYVNRGQADGLAFSIRKGHGVAPSLNNIFAEIKRDIPGTLHSNSNLEAWAKQGVLLLNSVLTTKVGHVGAHAESGWEEMTDKILVGLQEVNPKVVYLLWGNFAKMKAPLIKKSLGVLQTSHPSPNSVDRGFAGCGHFSKTNELLVAAGLQPIDWST